MNCPKCSAQMRRDMKPLSAESGDSFTHGWTCWCCGKWIEAEIEPVCPMPPREVTASTPQQRSDNMQAVIDWMYSIIKERQRKTSWVAIAKLINTATGQHFKYSTLQRNFHRLVYDTLPELRKYC